MTKQVEAGAPLASIRHFASSASLPQICTNDDKAHFAKKSRISIKSYIHTSKPRSISAKVFCHSITKYPGLCVALKCQRRWNVYCGVLVVGVFLVGDRHRLIHPEGTVGLTSFTTPIHLTKRRRHARVIPLAVSLHQLLCWPPWFGHKCADSPPRILRGWISAVRPTAAYHSAQRNLPSTPHAENSSWPEGLPRSYRHTITSLAAPTSEPLKRLQRLYTLDDRWLQRCSLSRFKVIASGFCLVAKPVVTFKWETEGNWTTLLTRTPKQRNQLIDDECSALFPLWSIWALYKINNSYSCAHSSIGLPFFLIKQTRAGHRSTWITPFFSLVGRWKLKIHWTPISA